MSRHYGTAIEPDQEPSPELEDFYEAMIWEPEKDERDLERELERIEYLEER